jgi:hypothetical protein
MRWSRGWALLPRALFGVALHSKHSPNQRRWNWIIYWRIWIFHFQRAFK